MSDFVLCPPILIWPIPGFASLIALMIPSTDHVPPLPPSTFASCPVSSGLISLLACPVTRTHDIPKLREPLPLGKSQPRCLQGTLPSKGPQEMHAWQRYNSLQDGEDHALSSCGAGPVDMPWTVMAPMASEMVSWDICAGLRVCTIVPCEPVLFAPQRCGTANLALNLFAVPCSSLPSESNWMHPERGAALTENERQTSDRLWLLFPSATGDCVYTSDPGMRMCTRSWPWCWRAPWHLVLYAEAQFTVFRCILQMCVPLHVLAVSL